MATAFGWGRASIVVVQADGAATVDVVEAVGSNRAWDVGGRLGWAVIGGRAAKLYGVSDGFDARLVVG